MKKKIIGAGVLLAILMAVKNQGASSPKIEANVLSMDAENGTFDYKVVINGKEFSGTAIPYKTLNRSIENFRIVSEWQVLGKWDKKYFAVLDQSNTVLAGYVINMHTGELQDIKGLNL